MSEVAFVLIRGYDQCSYDDPKRGHLKPTDQRNMVELNVCRYGRWVRTEQGKILQYSTLHPQVEPIEFGPNEVLFFDIHGELVLGPFEATFRDTDNSIKPS